VFRVDDSVLECDCKEIALLSDWVLKGNVELAKRYEVPFAHKECAKGTILPYGLRKAAAEGEKRKFLCLQKSFQTSSGKHFELLYIFDSCCSCFPFALYI
jgi:hypothetical protein